LARLTIVASGVSPSLDVASGVSPSLDVASGVSPSLNVASGFSRKIAVASGFRRTCHWLAALVLLLLPALASADVVDRSPGGFTVQTAVTIGASPDRAFLALVQDIGSWWDSAHTFSGDAGNLWLTANPGGCFCETLANGGGVAHAVVNHAVAGELLRMTGALGPLQEHAVTGTLTWQFAKAASGTTATMTYRVSGYFPGGLDKVADAVDTVLSGQLKRLKAYLERNTR
jgi:uncharacterized protein YndB with AHSA1/START domain